jgi:polyhydroxyalkanoate synthase
MTDAQASPDSKPKSRRRKPAAAATADLDGAAPGPETPAATEPGPEMAGEDVERATEQILGANPVIGFSKEEVFDAFRRLFGVVAARPDVILREHLALAQELVRVVTGSSRVQPDRKDRRFAHEVWQKNGYYKRVMQSYLAWRKTLHDILESTDAKPEDKERARFALALVTEAAAPTNTLLGNPGAAMRIAQTRGMSLVKGAQNMLDDLMHNGGMPKQVDERAFRVGKNLATTPGAVVYRDDVFELIQYAPQSAEVRARPLVLVPPQINKFYMVDLAPGKSFAEYAVKHGVQFFAISWRNPTAAQRDWNLETYLKACKKALEVACDIAGSEDANLVAACAGGYTAATLLGHYAALGERRVHSATLLVTVLDSSSPTLMGLFASEQAIAAAIRKSRATGVLEGREMARVFAWLRPNDLVWSFFANNYVMGNDPPAFDILAWNADCTRLPAEFHADMLMLYQHNPLVKPGRLEVLGTPVDMRKVKCDTFVVAGVTDHITPWKACYETRKVLPNSAMRFVLSSSGHIQSIVNPPGNERAKYYTSADLALEPDEWLKSAKTHQGSWWDHWREWMEARAGALKPAPRELGNRHYPAGDKAPGRYVHQR